MPDPGPPPFSPRQRELPEVAALPLQSELPDPLRMFDGSSVLGASDWFARRRPELIRLFEHYMYGYAPVEQAACEFRLEGQGDALRGKARWKRVTLRVTQAASVRPIELLLLTPADAGAPRGTFLALNFKGNHALIEDPVVPPAWCGSLASHPSAMRGAEAAAWDLERVLARGYALACVHTCDIRPDTPETDEGVQRYFMPSAALLGPHAWGALRAWAWGLSRAVDYLQSDDRVGSRPIAVVGHSRLGKAALVAAAFDERIALGIALQAGCGGSAPSRSSVGESVRQINDGFPHWFCAAFKQFNAEPARLPFDQHCLAALVAPRPLLFANATLDTWANPAGQFDMLRAAHPVYQLLGAGGLESERLPAPGELSAGRLGYFLREGGHSMSATDWGAFLDFADRHLG